jgi:hypothetical protein
MNRLKKIIDCLRDTWADFTSPVIGVLYVSPGYEPESPDYSHVYAARCSRVEEARLAGKKINFWGEVVE